MKKGFSILILLTGFLLTMLVFSACKKALSANTHIAVAGLMAFNLIPDSTGVGVSVGGLNLTTEPLYYPNYTGNYAGVTAGGTENVTFYNFGSGAPLVTSSQLFADSSYYSAFAVGVNGRYENFIVKDVFDTLSSASGNAYIRYVNAITDTNLPATVTISSNGNNVFDTSAVFPSASNFKGVTPGNVSVNVSSESGVTTSRTIAVQQGYIYTILLVGEPAATDSIKKIQVKYIQNGQLTP